ncbi:MAG: cupin domain-containing protein [Prevotellaceae bacterium]|jgi:quercetin dioxygenase-like cupin family protein|nr:cupin domain-containing protein [Prevotellaceae bacterium]
MRKFILFLFLPLLAGGMFTAANAQQQAENQQKWTIENCVATLDPAKGQPTKAGYQFWFADKDFTGDGRTLKMSVVAPRKATHAPHQHAEDEFFFVVEGTAKFYLNGDSITAKPYTTFYAPPHSLHGIANAGDTEMKYLVVKKYNLNP